MKQSDKPYSQIIAIGKQLRLSTEQIESILNNTQPTNEHLVFSLGPPMYGGALYGVVSITDFHRGKK